MQFLTLTSDVFLLMKNYCFAVGLLLVLQVIDNEDGKDAITRVDVLDYHDDVTSSSPVGAIESSYVRLMPLTGRYKMTSLRPS